MENVVIVGSGSAGWLTAISLVNQNFNVTLVESPDIPVIGVGESTQPAVTSFIEIFGKIPLDEWMHEVGATYKMGVLVDGWSDLPVFVDSESASYHSFTGSRGIESFILTNKISPEDYLNRFDAYLVAKNNKSPCIDSFHYGVVNGEGNNKHTAVQWDSMRVQKFFKEKCLSKDNFTLLQENMVDVIFDENEFVKEIKLSNELTVSGDWYFDCTGFHRKILSKYNSQWYSFSNMLLNNSAVVIRKKYIDPRQECHPYTKATAMDFGWKWGIPTYDDMSHGYVYSNNYISKEDAEKELRTKINEWNSSALHVPFTPGISSPMAYKNVIAAGLSGAFVEPLQATSLAFTCLSVANFIQNYRGPSTDIDSLNTIYHRIVAEIVSFITAHYYFCQKNDNQYWKDVKKTTLLPYVNDIFEKVKNGDLLGEEELSQNSMFHGGHWFQLLYPYGLYKNYKSDLSYKINELGKINYARKNLMQNELIDLLPNHYDYLTECRK